MDRSQGMCQNFKFWRIWYHYFDEDFKSRAILLYVRNAREALIEAKKFWTDEELYVDEVEEL